MRIVATAIAAAWLSASPSALAQQMQNPIRSGAWAGGDYYANGQFQHCAVAARYTRGHAIVFAVDRTGAFWIALSHDQWALTVGQQYPVDLSVDGQLSLQRAARAVSARQVVIAVDARQAFFDLVRKGYRLSVRTQRMDMGYDLTGSYAALSEAVACATRLSAQDQRPVESNPFAAPPPPAGANPFAAETRAPPGVPFSAAPPPGTSPFPGQSAAESPPKAPPSQSAARPLPPPLDKERSHEMAVRLLAGAGFRFQAADVPGLRRTGYQTMWALPGGVVGGLLAWENTPGDAIPRIGSAVIARDARLCAGQFASGQRETEIDGGWSGRRVFTLCRNPSSGSDWSANYSVARFVNGVSVVVVSMQPRLNATAADPAEIDARLFGSAGFRRLTQASP